MLLQLPTHPSLLPFHLILTKGHNTSFIRPYFLPFPSLPHTLFFLRLSPCLLCLPEVSFMVLESRLTHSLCAASIVSLFRQLYHTSLRGPMVFNFFFFCSFKRTLEDACTHTHPLSISSDGMVATVSVAFQTQMQMLMPKAKIQL